MEELRRRLVEMGWSAVAANLAAIAAAVVAALLIGWAVRRIASAPVSRAFDPSGLWNEAARRARVPERTGHVLAIIVLGLLLRPWLQEWPVAQHRTALALGGILVLALAALASALVSAIAEIVATRHADEHRLPVKALAQGLQLTVWTYAAVALVAVLTESDVASVLTGLTALGAVLVYVFRDPLLGWTAGVQIAANDLVRVGDWISVPQHRADGTVEEIALTSVKVRNWDKTISTVPTYSLISEGFRNWRGMFRAGARRIKRSIAIDATSVRFCDEALLAGLERSPSLQTCLDLASERHPTASPESERVPDPISDLRPTNLGLFRTWLLAWLGEHPSIHEDMTTVVRELEADGRGVPIEVYVFSNDTRWAHFERLQAEIFDHLLAVLPEFELRVFQEPSGEDLRRSGA